VGRQRLFRWGLPLILTLAVLAPLALGAGCGGSYEDPTTALEPFRQAIDTYTGPFKGASDVKVYTPGRGKPQGYIKGGVVLVEGTQVPLFHNSLPARLRAAIPADVGTVVLVKESSRKVGEYSDGATAWQTVWKVSVVDLAKGRVVDRALLRGEHAPFAADIDAGENYGPPPRDELVACLEKLPRR